MVVVQQQVMMIVVQKNRQVQVKMLKKLNPQLMVIRTELRMVIILRIHRRNRKNIVKMMKVKLVLSLLDKIRQKEIIIS